MSRENKNENLISIEEFIARAKRFGVDFGNGDPKNRLRYYVKIGLLPHAQRKSFNGLPPNGAYSEKALGILLEIDKKLKVGKSIREIKREKEEKVFEKSPPKITTPYTYIHGLGSSIKFSHLKTEVPQTEKEEELEVKETSEIIGRRPFVKIQAILKIVFLVLICVSIVFFVNAKINFIDSIFYFLANISEFRKLTQLPTLSFREEVFSLPAIEPYLTINAETAINAPLKVKEKITAPSFILIRDEFEGRITVASLTAEREYSFPDLSGTVCLTTGNCIGLRREVITPGGTSNRLAKFISTQEVGDSSISDLYLGGVAITIDSAGNVGIGTLVPRAKLEVAGDLITTGRVGVGIENPGYSLHIEGRIQATGDICTDLVGGRCLSTLPVGGGGGARGIGGSGSANYLPIWTGSTSLGNSILYQTGGNIGINTTAPSQKLDVAGTIKMTGFQLPTNATSGYVLASDASGFGTWQPLPEGVLPSGILGQTLRHNGTSWIANSFFYNTGSAIGIGTTSTLYTLNVAGDGLFQGPLTIDTSILGQLVLKYDDNNNYLKFSINGSQAEILSSKTMLINSLTGEVRLAGGVTLFDAPGAEVRGRTFISTTTDSTVRKSGEMVFRASLPIFIFPVPAQTASSGFVVVTSSSSPSALNTTLPDTLPGATRKFAFLINFADDIPISASSTWLVDLTVGSDIEFYFAGQNISILKEGIPHLSDFILPPENNWQLKVKVPSGNKIRIFNILLLAYDQIN